MNEDRTSSGREKRLRLHRKVERFVPVQNLTRSILLVRLHPSIRQHERSLHLFQQKLLLAHLVPHQPILKIVESSTSAEPFVDCCQTNRKDNLPATKVHSCRTRHSNPNPAHNHQPAGQIFHRSASKSAATSTGARKRSPAAARKYISKSASSEIAYNSALSPAAVSCV